jgi:hypothetical protein
MKDSKNTSLITQCICGFRKDVAVKYHTNQQWDVLLVFTMGGLIELRYDDVESLENDLRRLKDI